MNELGNQVVFQVPPHANKGEIRRAVETLFKVKVEKVRTAQRPRQDAARRPSWAAGRTGRRPT